jgi:hypothetical protein
MNPAPRRRLLLLRPSGLGPLLWLALAACGGGRRVTEVTPLAWAQADILSARAAHAMCYDAVRGEHVVLGGAPVADMFVLDAALQRPRRVGGLLPPARSGHAMAYDIARGRTVLFGGFDGTAVLADTWEWDGIAWQVRAGGEAVPARFGHCMAYDPVQRRILLFGGAGASGVLGDTWAWDGFGWRRLQLATSPPARTAAAMATTGTRGTLLFGGTQGTTLYDDAWLFDGANWTKHIATVPIASAGPSARAGHILVQASMLGDALLFGGYGSGENGETWLFTADRRWQRMTLPVSPAPRVLHAAAYDTTSQRVVLVGGLLATGPSSDVWVFAEGAWVQRLDEQHPAARHDFAMAADDSSVLLFGGDLTGLVPNGAIATVGSAEGTSETWVWRADRWQRVQPATTPPARSKAAMAYDGPRGRYVMFGGSAATSQLLGDTWEWDGQDWRALAVPGPAPRAGHAMAFDAGRRRVVLFGGRSDTALLDDLWEWDGALWVRSTALAGPTAREQHGLAWHQASARLVLFGGRGEAGELADTWAFDGATWEPRAVAFAPSARVRAGLAAGFGSDRVLLFGGEHNAQALSDVWEWNGARWETSTMRGSPGARAGHGLVRLRRAVFCFGGQRGLSLLADTWFATEPPRA